MTLCFEYESLKSLKLKLFHISVMKSQWTTRVEVWSGFYGLLNLPNPPQRLMQTAHLAVYRCDHTTKRFLPNLAKKIPHGHTTLILWLNRCATRVVNLKNPTSTFQLQHRQLYKDCRELSNSTQLFITRKRSNSPSLWPLLTLVLQDGLGESVRSTFPSAVNIKVTWPTGRAARVTNMPGLV